MFIEVYTDGYYLGNVVESLDSPHNSSTVLYPCDPGTNAFTHYFDPEDDQIKAKPYQPDWRCTWEGTSWQCPPAPFTQQPIFAQAISLSKTDLNICVLMFLTAYSDAKGDFAAYEIALTELSQAIADVTAL
jgi:hypothetical protein